MTVGTRVLRGHAPWLAALALGGCGSGGGASPDVADAAIPDDARSGDARSRDAANAPDAEPRADASTDGSIREASVDATDARADSTESGVPAPDAEPDASTPRCGLAPGVLQPAELLSETGCVDMADPTAPTGDLIPYTVVSPLWSDGAEKHRFVALPPGGQIHVKDCNREPAACDPLTAELTPEDEGHFRFPVGTVLVKTFVLADQLIETRLLIRLSEATYRGFSYEWNEEETEATRLDSGKDRAIGSQVWHYPSRAECLQCHTEAAGRTLGPTTRQMNIDFVYPDGTRNQITHLRDLGAFEEEPQPLPPYPDPALTDADTRQARVRAYLATNCSICHRPGGTLDDIDLRYTTPFVETDLCNQPIARGTGDPALPQTRLVPGMPDASSLSFRMHDEDIYRMPQIGSNVVDPAGVALIDGWIASLSECPE